MSEDKISVKLGTDGVEFSQEGAEVGELSGHLCNILSPFSQIAAFFGDRFLEVRTLTTIKIHERFSQLAKDSGVEVHPIPQKTLYRLFKTASLEDPESDLIDCWSRLLLSTTQNEEALNTLFIEILGRMSSKQADIFRSISTIDPCYKPNSKAYSDRNKKHIVSLRSDVESSYLEAQHQSSPSIVLDGKFAEQLIAETEWSQFLICDYSINFGRGPSQFEQHSIDIIATELLVREGLVDRVKFSIGEGSQSRWNFTINGLELTVIGGLFADAILLGKGL